MGSDKTFIVDVPDLDDGLLEEARKAGATFDVHAKKVLAMAKTDDQYLGPPGFIEHIELTFRELGCTEHPTDREALSPSRLLAWSARNLLSKKKVLDYTEAAALIVYTLKHPEIRPGVLIAGMEPLATVGMGCLAVLTSVQLAGEWWFYGVPIESGHRFSLDHRVLLQVRDAKPGELASMELTSIPTQPAVTKRAVLPVRPEPIINEYPGKFCGQEAMRSLLLGFGKNFTLKSFRMRGLLALYGWIYNIWLARTVPWDIAAMLRARGFDAHSCLWLTGNFERKLKAAIDAGYYVDVISYAQRRFHGQHSELVSGYEEYGGRTYFYATDAQFEKKEYALPQGNVLLSTEDFIRSFPRYGLWLFSFGVLVVLAKPRS